MFENGIKIVEQFTRPVFSISRNFESDNIKLDSATIFFVNELGFAITTGDILDRLFPKPPYYEKYEKFKHERIIPDCDIEKLKLDYGYNSSDSIIELKTIFLNCGNVIDIVRIYRHPNYNIGLLYFENVSGFTYNGYAKFLSSEKHFNKGKELMRLGYPFPQGSNYFYNHSIDQIEWDLEKPFFADNFPLKGIITLHSYNNKLLNGIVMSTPGYKGHEGSPLFDENGLIYGMHYTNSNFNFANDNNYPNADFGICISSKIITQFLLETGIKFYQIEDGNEIVYNENNTLPILPVPLVPTFYIAGEGESSVHISEVKMSIGGELIVDYNEPFKIAIGKTDDNSKKDGVALVQFSIDGQNEIFITEENAGNVSHLEKNNNYQLEVIKKEIKTEKWKVKASVKAQSYFPYYYFDLLIIRRNAERDHIKDPHIAFFPDASGKYIRYDNEKAIKIVTKKTIKDKNSAILPLHSKVEADEFEINIIYIISENSLCISDLSLKDKTI